MFDTEMHDVIKAIYSYVGWPRDTIKFDANFPVLSTPECEEIATDIILWFMRVNSYHHIFTIEMANVVSECYRTRIQQS